MWTSKKVNTIISSLIVLFVFTTNLTQAQKFNLNNSESSLTILGTSSLHDWHVVAEKQSGEILFKNLEGCEISMCKIEIQTESLKSGKNAMDKNTYKALKTDDFKTINFQLIEVKGVKSKGNGAYSIQSIGDLTITGVKKRIPLNFDIIINENVSFTGEKEIKMTDYNITPPKALFGTITTGDDLTIKFSTIFK